MESRKIKTAFIILGVSLIGLISFSNPAQADQSNNQSNKNKGIDIGSLLPGHTGAIGGGSSLPASTMVTATTVSNPMAALKTTKSISSTSSSSFSMGKGKNRSVFSGNWKKGNMKLSLSSGILKYLRAHDFNKLSWFEQQVVKGEIKNIARHNLSDKQMNAVIKAVTKKVRRESLSALAKGQIFTIKSWSKVTSVKSQ